MSRPHEDSNGVHLWVLLSLALLALMYTMPDWLPRLVAFLGVMQWPL